jgi:3-oxoacyl-[acyl-carrier protein] reductase
VTTSSDRFVQGFADLSGLAALVTGAGSETGIGFACARRLCRLGAHVVLASTTERIQLRVAELRAMGVSATGLVADLTDPDQANPSLAEAALAGAATWTCWSATPEQRPCPTGRLRALLTITDAAWRSALDRQCPRVLGHPSRPPRCWRGDTPGHRIFGLRARGRLPGDAAFHAAKAGMANLSPPCRSR